MEVKDRYTSRLIRIVRRANKSVSPPHPLYHPSPTHPRISMSNHLSRVSKDINRKILESKEK